MDPRHFNQMYCTSFPDPRGYDSIWYQDSWPNPGRASREDVALAIAEAEEMMAEIIGYWVAPKYTTDDRQIFPFVNYPRSGRRPLSVELERLKFIAGGCRVVTLIEEDVDISASRVDNDHDDWGELMVFSITDADASSWNIDEIAVYPSDSDTDDIYRIKGLKITISGTTITVKGQSPQFTIPELWGTDQAIDGDDDAVFLDSVDIYRVHTVSSETHPPVRFMYKDLTVYPPYTTTYGVLEEVIAKRGLVQAVPAVWSDVTSSWSVSTLTCTMLTKPDHLLLNYVSGHPLLRGEVHPKLARAIAALATSRLTSPISGGGESVEKIYNEWQRRSDDDSFQRKNCPFGDRNGAWIAWQICHTMFGSLDSFSL